MKKLRKGWLFGIAVSAVLAAGVWFRGAGLWHGLDQEIVFHPDEPKQVKRLESYLRGVYVHHVGSRFYDGYPYGLNRVDEGLLRAWQGLAAMAGSWAEGKGSVSAGLPDHVAVYRQARVLRLLYGMAAALLVFAAARRWGAGRWAALAGAALYAASPLASLVSHAATGDIGVDLSVAAALYAAAALAVGGRAAWWVAFGAACGAGWACKFQGALAAWMAVPPLLLGLRDGWRGWKRLAGAGLLAAAGFAGAAVLLNPALALDTSRAWKDTWQNFGFIQNYGVPPERLAWPFGRKVAWGLSHNVPFVAGCLGWGLVAVGLAASAVLAGASWRKALGRVGAGDAEVGIPGPDDPAEPAPTPEEARAEAEASARASRWLLGIATFPWLAFLLATALKLEVQPFHFTFLVPPLALGVALAISWWTEPPDGAPRPPAAAAALALAAAVLAEEACGAAREAFFWRRPDIRDAARLQAEAAFGDAGWGMGRHAGKARGIKRYYVEPATLPCFRNAASVLACPGEAWREGQALLPVPPVPMPSSAGDCWIFMDGPVFPRSDRMFAVPATGNGHRQPAAAADGSPLYADTLSARGAWTERILAFPAAPRNLRIGLRTGRMPVRCEVTTSLSGAATPRLLPPESQTVLELPRPDPVYAFAADGEAGRPAVWACRLRVRAQLGPVWVTVLGSPEEEELFALHGPGAAPAVHPVAADLPLFAGELERIRYLDSAGPLVLPADGDAPLPPPVPGAGPGLPAGPYLFRARVDSPAPAEVSFLLADRNESDAPDALPSARFAVPAGESDIEWRFQKPYAPYGATLRASAGIPGVTLLSWNLKPDPVALAAEGGYVPPPPAAPLLPGGADPDAVPATPLGLSYPGIGTLLDIRIPDAWHVSDTVPYAVTVRLDPSIPHKRFAELAFFLHLEDANGGLAWTLDYNLPAATFEGGPVRWKLNTPNLAPGTYTLTAGLFVARHGKKVPFAPHRRSMEVKRVTVLPDE
ncbi:MAG: glycosyltransferase family 39 protein [Kiritimatiellae bacterium]|nr:glycosyltransferase family 39 protein [Kiritimatiellia bacterium]